MPRRRRIHFGEIAPTIVWVNITYDVGTHGTTIMGVGSKGVYLIKEPGYGEDHKPQVFLYPRGTNVVRYEYAIYDGSIFLREHYMEYVARIDAGIVDPDYDTSPLESPLE